MPQSTIDSLIRYRDDKIPTGGFLQAVLAMDLYSAAIRADHVHQPLLWDVAAWIVQNLPRDCWGDRETVNAWLARFGEE